jgi:hypothetical protein
MYDSRPDTWQHIHTVQKFMHQVVQNLLLRAHRHDQSKLGGIERRTFDEFTPKLKDSTYGSDEYKGFLNSMKPALDRHYAWNDHHPEHFDNGVADMDLVQMTEMLVDWKAATLRHDDGDLAKSIKMNADRFGYSPEIERLLMNTARNFGWL